MNKKNHFSYLVTYVDRLMKAPCLPENEPERNIDIAKTLQMAGLKGFDELHNYMELLCEYAEKGKYKYPSIETVSKHVDELLKSESTSC